MKRCLENDDTINERNRGASSSRSRPTHINDYLTNNADESETQIHSINETTDSNDDIMTNNTSEIKQNEISLNEKRTDYLSWDDLFMAIASLTANFGTDVGACIVDMDKKIVGIGYNELIHDPGLDFDFLRMCECSAEMNAILNKNSINVQDCTIYVSRYPCNERTKVIIQSGIKEVVYLEPRPNLASKKMFDASGIKIRNHTPKQTRLHFKEPNEKKLSFDDLYMTIAYLIAQRSKDPVTQVGACIVDSDHKIVSTGYNGMPTGCNDDDFPWGKSDPSEFKKKFMYVCHAEMNAVFYKSSINVKGCTIYVSVFPCVKCAIIILKSGIKNVVYYWDPKSGKKKNIKIKSMFKSYGIITRYHQPIQNTRLEISTTA